LIGVLPKHGLPTVAILPVASYEGKIAQIARRSAEGISMQTVILNGLKVLSRDDISNHQPLSFSLVAGDRQYDG
jgi:hypothetical protein